MNGYNCKYCNQQIMLKDTESHDCPAFMKVPEPLFTHMNRREYFAAMAMQGLLSIVNPLHNKTSQSIAEESIEYADALIVELEKK